ncbi:MAG: FkbM family methyltransferase [Synergistaceae bacterium]|nr:FkbM family methyltransferase [Synergistaceae bacterium]
MNSQIKRLLYNLLPPKLILWNWEYRRQRYLTEERLTMVPCKTASLSLGYDTRHGLNYAFYSDGEFAGTRLYYPNTDISKLNKYERYIIETGADFRIKAQEMDINSPHRYVTAENPIIGTIYPPPQQHPTAQPTPFFVSEGEIVADVGCEAANFALSVAGVAKTLYLFEGDSKWTSCLKATFEPYSDKTNVISKYISDVSSDSTITLDDYFQNKEVNFIKMDVEGFERRCLAGAKKLLKRDNVRWSVCVYHRLDDAEVIGKIFADAGYETEFTPGWMLRRPQCEVVDGEPHILRSQRPTPRRVVIRAWK